MVEHQSDTHLDLRGLKCPLPVIKAKRLLKEMSPKQVLHLVCSDPMTQIDIPHMAHELGHVLLSSEVRGQEFLFWLQRK